MNDDVRRAHTHSFQMNIKKNKTTEMYLHSFRI